MPKATETWLKQCCKRSTAAMNLHSISWHIHWFVTCQIAPPLLSTMKLTSLNGYKTYLNLPLLSSSVSTLLICWVSWITCSTKCAETMNSIRWLFWRMSLLKCLDGVHSTSMKCQAANCNHLQEGSVSNLNSWINKRNSKKPPKVEMR